MSIPARSTTVREFSGVFGTGSRPHSPSRTVENHLRLAGGLTKGAGDSCVFLILANGSVGSSLRVGGVISHGKKIGGLVTAPGDSFFLAEDPNEASWGQQAQDWTQTLYPPGIGIDGIKSAIN